MLVLGFCAKIRELRAVLPEMEAACAQMNRPCRHTLQMKDTAAG